MNILQYLPDNVRVIIARATEWLDNELLEIRLRVKQPLQIITYKGDFFLTAKGRKADGRTSSYVVTEADIRKAVLILTDNSIYAVERQLREGFITIKGGHRVGFTGEVIYGNGRIESIKNINSLNYRITREIIGVGENIVKKIYDFKHDLLYNTLIISPPLCGKTTLLRDLIRIISNGIPELNIEGKKVSVVDERSELAGAYKGIPQNTIGKRTDILDNCPKAEGMMLLIRSMSPDIIAVDEIGRKDDIGAIEEAANSGVSLLTTVHSSDLNSLKLRPSFQKMLADKIFQRFIILSNNKGIGTIEKVVNELGEEID